jgi:hypothetical protein
MDRILYPQFLGGFESVILEESFVLNLKTTMSFVEFQVNFAVNEQYPLYVKPQSRDTAQVVKLDEANSDSEWQQGQTEERIVEDEDSEYEIPEGFMQEGLEDAPSTEPEHPYRRGRIFFPNMEQVRWASRIQPYIDPRNGQVDYGSIDYFYQGEDGRYYLAGYWGELEIASGIPLLEIDELKEHQQRQYEQAKAAKNKAS